MPETTQPTVQNQWTISPLPTPIDALAKSARLLMSVTYCSLSTCSANGMPWVSPVFFAFDDALNFYWSSAIAATHSQNIYNNQGRCAIVLYQSQKSAAPTNGLYFTGTASELETAGVERVCPLIDSRSGSPVPRSRDDYLGESVRRMYQFVPTQVWSTGERFAQGKQLVDTKVLLDLETLKAHVHQA